MAPCRLRNLLFVIAILYPDARAGFGPALDGKPGAHSLGALAHGAQAEVTGKCSRWIETFAVIDNTQRDLSIFAE